VRTKHGLHAHATVVDKEQKVIDRKENKEIKKGSYVIENGMML